VVHRKQGTRTDQLVYNVNKLKRGGNSKSYLLRRIARDAPEVLADYEHGKYKSVRAAAKAAGIIKDRASELTPDGDAIIRRINEKDDALKRDLKELIEWIKTCEDVEILTFLATDTTLIELAVERQMYAKRHLGPTAR
jgi:hypothetical protein